MGYQFRIVAKGAKDGQVKTRYVDGLKENCPADTVENTDEYMRCVLPKLVEHAARDGLFEWWQIWEYQTLIAASENAPQAAIVTGLPLAPGPDGKPLPVGDEIQMN